MFSMKYEKITHCTSIVVMPEKNVYVYKLLTMERMVKIENSENTHAVLCASAFNNVVAFPSEKQGYVHLLFLDPGSMKQVKAHDGVIRQLALNRDGTKLATASVKGTVIRVIDTAALKVIQEVRRSIDPATIYALMFNQHSSFFVCCSEKGTVHIFAHKSDQKQDAGYVAKFSEMVGYGNYDRSVATFKGPETASLCCFGMEDNSVIGMLLQTGILKIFFCLFSVCSKWSKFKDFI